MEPSSRWFRCRRLRRALQACIIASFLLSSDRHLIDGIISRISLVNLCGQDKRPKKGARLEAGIYTNSGGRDLHRFPALFRLGSKYYFHLMKMALEEKIFFTHRSTAR